MNEFIVWDEKSKKFYDSGFFKTPKGLLVDYDLFSTKDKIAFNDIGETDTNGKKIYADSSIVEFDYDDLNGYYNKVKGYFYRDKWQIRLKVLESETCLGVDNLPMAYQNPKDLKIIDTIQENKLGLYNKDK